MIRPALKAFTLIELLMVVATIAILAAIAVPNFLEAQVRSKVSRTKSDLAAMEMGVRSYFADHNQYPANRASVRSFLLDAATTTAAIEKQPVDPENVPPELLPYERINTQNLRMPQVAVSGYDLYVLTTPVAYLGTLEPDPFADMRGLPYAYLDYSGIWDEAAEAGYELCRDRRYLLLSYGPNTDLVDPDFRNPVHGPWIRYEPTNGTVSVGNLLSFGNGSDLNTSCPLDLAPLAPTPAPAWGYMGERMI